MSNSPGNCFSNWKSSGANLGGLHKEQPGCPHFRIRKKYFLETQQWSRNWWSTRLSFKSLAVVSVRCSVGSMCDNTPYNWSMSSTVAGFDTLKGFPFNSRFWKYIWMHEWINCLYMSINKRINMIRYGLGIYSRLQKSNTVAKLWNVLHLISCCQKYILILGISFLRNLYLNASCFTMSACDIFSCTILCIIYSSLHQYYVLLLTKIGMMLNNIHDTNI